MLVGYPNITTYRDLHQKANNSFWYDRISDQIYKVVEVLGDDDTSVENTELRLFDINGGDSYVVFDQLELQYIPFVDGWVEVEGTLYWVENSAFMTYNGGHRAGRTFQAFYYSGEPYAPTLSMLNNNGSPLTTNLLYIKLLSKLMRREYAPTGPFDPARLTQPGGTVLDSGYALFPVIISGRPLTGETRLEQVLQAAVMASPHSKTTTMIPIERLDSVLEMYNNTLETTRGELLNVT